MTIGPASPPKGAHAHDVHDAHDAPLGNLEDVETQAVHAQEKGASVFKSLSYLDRFLAIWILLAMVTGVLLGNFVPETGRVLQQGKFVGVSVPIGMCAVCRLLK